MIRRWILAVSIVTFSVIFFILVFTPLFIASVFVRELLEWRPNPLPQLIACGLLAFVGTFYIVKHFYKWLRNSRPVVGYMVVAGGIFGLFSSFALPMFLLPASRELNQSAVVEAPEARPVPSPPPADRFDAIDRTLEHLEFGNVAFNTPKTMIFDDTAVIQLMLALQGIEPDELKRMIEAEGEKEGARIRVSDRMEARLSGNNFAITAITPEQQAVSRRTVTEWKWEVRPLHVGIPLSTFSVRGYSDFRWYVVLSDAFGPSTG